MKANKKLVLIAVCFAVLVISVILFVVIQSSTPEAKVKQAIAEEVKRSDFNVDEILMEDSDFLLAKITYSGSRDSAYTIAKRENGNLKMVLNLGSGDFDTDKLLSADVPDGIIKYLLGNPPYFIGIDDKTLTVDGAKKVKSLLASYAKMKKQDIELYRLVSDSYRHEHLTNYERYNDIAYFFDVTLDDKTKVHFKIITPYSGDITYELYDEDGGLVFSVK